MKRLISLVLILALAALSTQVFAQRVLRIDEAAVGEADPAKATDYADSILMFNLYDALVYPGAAGNLVEPHVAHSWEVSDDGRIWTFHLRDDVTFHDGTPLTAEDVVFSMERMLALGQGFSFLFADLVAETTALDEHTVQFTLAEPFAPFLGSLVRLPIVNQQLVLANLQAGDYGDLGDYGQAFLGSNDAGSGPYTITSHDPTDLTVMVRHPEYFLGFADNAPDEVRMRYSVEAATLRSLLLRGEHEVSSQWLPPEVLRALANDPNIDLVTESGGSMFYFMMNTQRAPTDDVHFRRAVALAFDTEALLSILRVTDDVISGTPAQGPFPSTFPGFAEGLQMPERDLEAARAELARSNFNPATDVVEIGWVAEVPIEERFSLLLQQNLAEIGVRAEVIRVPWSLMTQRASQPDTTPHISNIYVAGNYPDPDSFLYAMYHSEAAGTWLSMSWLQNPEIDAMLEAGRTTVDPEERLQIYREIQERLVELQPAIYAYEQISVFARRANVTLPQLENPELVTPVMGANWNFRLVEIE
jgi:peptide/nickel transport system substrate-binding protein